MREAGQHDRLGSFEQAVCAKRFAMACLENRSSSPSTVELPVILHACSIAIVMLEPRSTVSHRETRPLGVLVCWLSNRVVRLFLIEYLKQGPCSNGPMDLGICSVERPGFGATSRDPFLQCLPVLLTDLCVR
jgi:hypothetical protein